MYVKFLDLFYFRIYVHHSDALLRFCPVKYYPFDPSVKDKYVVQGGVNA